MSDRRTSRSGRKLKCRGCDEIMALIFGVGGGVEITVCFSWNSGSIDFGGFDLGGVHTFFLEERFEELYEDRIR